MYLAKNILKIGSSGTSMLNAISEETPTISESLCFAGS